MARGTRGTVRSGGVTPKPAGARGGTKMSATSRDPEEWAARTKAARATRERVAHEVAEALRAQLPQLADTIAVQVAELIVVGDAMGGRSRIAVCIEQIVRAEQRGDTDVLRSSVVELAVSAGAWVAALDFEMPEPEPEAEAA